MRLFWLKADLLHPVDKGGKIRTYGMLRELKKHHHITYLALDDGSGASDARERAAEYCHELVPVPHRTSRKLTAGFYKDLAVNLLSPLPYAVARYRSAAFRRAVERAAYGNGADLIVCDFLAPGVNLPDELPCPLLLFQHNVEAVIWQRHAEVQRSRLGRLYFREQWRRMRVFERRVCRRSDAIVAVSPDDRDRLVREYGAAPVYDIPTGVDTAYFRPSGAVPREPFHLVFTGSMDWLPNDDAMMYFIHEMWPAIRDAIPGAVLTIVGRDPYPRLKERARTDPHIVVTGRVDDVRPYIERASVYVIPLRIGGGTRLKVFEAMAMEKPIVSTSVGVEGLPVTDGDDVLIADQPRAFAGAVLRLLKEEAFARRLGRRAAANVRARFGWERVAQVFADLCQETVERRAGRLHAA